MTFGRSPRGKFVFQKVSKIRWRPPQGGRNTGTHLVTGSWDDEVTILNQLRPHNFLGMNFLTLYCEDKISVEVGLLNKSSC
jgi:hypothetical protein